MNQIARHPSHASAEHPGKALSGLFAALRETAALLVGRSAYAVYAPPPAYWYAVSRRARRFMRGGE